MDKETAWQWIKEKIGGIGFRVFLWSVGMTQDEYLAAIEQQGVMAYLDWKETVESKEPCKHLRRAGKSTGTGTNDFCIDCGYFPL